MAVRWKPGWLPPLWRNMPTLGDVIQAAKAPQAGLPDQTSSIDAELQQAFGVGLKELIMLLAAIKIAKMEGGMKLLETLGKEFIKGTFDTLHALGQASAANNISAWANPYLVSIVLERFGFVPSSKMLEFRAGLSILAGAEAVESLADTLQGIFPFTSPEPSPFPSNIVYSARSEGGQVVQETTEAKGLSIKEMEQIRSLLTKKPPE
ncbi:MAG: hypothetical protein OEZ18_00660 [Candidatus Bathyarchaeota archaeon]|nr:hypothetical protein [Candidatus Bathyarchaeota archaeon]